MTLPPVREPEMAYMGWIESQDIWCASPDGNAWWARCPKCGQTWQSSPNVMPAKRTAMDHLFREHIYPQEAAKRDRARARTETRQAGKCGAATYDRTPCQNPVLPGTTHCSAGHRIQGRYKR
jgi:hypothetical protein